MTDVREALAAPFEEDQVEWRAGATNADKTRALALAYISARTIMDRLDDTVGIGNWRDQYRPGPAGGVLCRLSLRISDEWVAKEDGADNPEFEAVKGGLSDAFKRAAVKWGVGRYLYALDSPWVACEERGRTVVLRERPTLPAWALPEGAKAARAEPRASEPAEEPEEETDFSSPPCPQCGKSTTHKSGTNKAGKDWEGYFCSVSKDHAPLWGPKRPNIPEDGPDIEFEAWEKSEVDKARAHFWAQAKEHGIAKQVDAHALWGLQPEKGALKAYVEERAKLVRTTEASIWRLLAKEIPGRVQWLEEGREMGVKE